MDQELLEAISQLMDEKLKPINSRLDGIDGRLDGIDGRLDGMENQLEALREAQEETRSGVNSLLEWAEECGTVVKFPLPKVK